MDDALRSAIEAKGYVRGLEALVMKLRPLMDKHSSLDGKLAIAAVGVAAGNMISEKRTEAEAAVNAEIERLSAEEAADA